MSQYGGTYDQQGRVQVGAPSGGFTPNPGSQATFVGTPFDWNSIPDAPGMASPDDRRASLMSSMERMHGGGFMGGVERGLGSLLGFAKELQGMPAGNMGVRNTWNPGSLGGLLPGPLGMVGGMIGQQAYNATGLPKPGWDNDPLQGQTLTDQIARR